ncbi:uncharacterized protein KQ657_004000 [Scheffersomyces spartinae]|uniref:Kinetochore-associated protein n=1 Tax=Scheffersomyces spartinae TaxID=45513 RepID=A0A9P7VBK3_9ASCO|nr:uncharacterized protein KQ657_004000 [Scheffersomyces spartinae]KAG7194892.1 hypothetical protein KQ657_004000 [Scheffersomyces spartinae]
MSVERVRYPRMRALCGKALMQVIGKGLSMDKFISCFPVLAESPEGMEALRNARQQVIGFWTKAAESEFETIFKERDLETKLDQLDEIVQAARLNRQRGLDQTLEVDKLGPSDIIEGTVVTKKKEAIANLEIMKQQLVQDNDELYRELASIVKEGEDTHQDIDTMIKDLQQQVEGLRDNSAIDFSIDDLAEIYKSTA